MSYEQMLKEAVEAAQEAGELLRRELHRFGGPKGHSMHADADEEAEWIIRKRLTKAFPEHGYRGEETGTIPPRNSFLWLIDPNDGTTAFLRGARGSAVSIAMLHERVPVLGVIYSFAAPDDRGDLICWAEGLPMMRNGKPVERKWDTTDATRVTLLVSLHRDQIIEGVIRCAAPYRYRANPSIAYRLALVAVRDAAVAVSWHGPGDWDYAAGHALLRAAGGIFVNEKGEEVSYAEDGTSRVKFCFGGEPSIVREISRRDWAGIRGMHSDKPDTALIGMFTAARPKLGKVIAKPDLLSRAHGCLMGQIAGDAVRPKEGSEQSMLAGQPTCDSEMALYLARSIAQEGKYNSEKVAQAYRYWFHKTHPIGLGSTTTRALRDTAEETQVAATMRQHATRESQTNGSFTRISPLGIYGYRKTPNVLWELADQENSLTHPSPICFQCCAIYVNAIAYAISKGASPQEVYDHALDTARMHSVESSVLQALEQAATALPQRLESMAALASLQAAFYELIHSNSFEHAVLESGRHAMITGALLGAVHGRESIPVAWRDLVLSCRPRAAADVAHPRPLDLWPVDVYTLAELLLIAG